MIILNDCVVRRYAVEEGECVMAEYIERDKLLKFKADVYDEDGHVLYAVPTGYIVAMPYDDVAPVVHGHWVSVPHKLARVCSVCNRDEPYKFADIDADVYDYCPNCGARMN